MDIAFNFKNFEPSEHLKEYARNRFDKLEKYVSDVEDAEIQVNLAVEKHRQKADIILNGEDIHISAYEESEDMYATIDVVLDKILAQLKKFREKKKVLGKRAGARSVRMDIISFVSTEGGGRERSIVTTDDFEPKPMDVEEAAMQLESKKHEFLVFRNAETDRINVIYTRRDGDFGLIDPGF